MRTEVSTYPKTYIYIYIFYLIENPTHTALEGAVAGNYSEAFGSVLRSLFVRAPKGFGVRTKRLRNKLVITRPLSINIFYHP